MMKTFLFILMIASMACSRPLTVTTRSDPHTATSGTLGSAKFTNRLPEGTGDTTKIKMPKMPTNDTIPHGRKKRKIKA